jgi:hypothetical protein
MKRRFKFLFLTIIPLFSYSQSIVDTTKLWSTYLLYYYQPYSNTEQIKFISDTLLDGVHYRKVLRTLEENPVNWSPYGFIREDSSKKVFYRLNGDDTEKLMYDFNVQLHDTIHVYGLYDYSTGDFWEMDYFVDSIDNVMVGGVLKKQYHMFYVSQWGMGTEVNQWIEDVGSANGVLRNYNGYVGCNWFKLLCYKKNGILQYMNPNYNSCYLVTGIDNLKNLVLGVTISPNPVTNISTFKISGLEKSDGISINIFNSIGKTILTKRNTMEFQINKNDFPAGIYYYNISNKSGIIGSGKIIVI